MDVPYFYYLLTKFTDPGEIFGPIDVPALVKEGKTERRYEGYAPTAYIIAFDEVFKASSAILNCTLNLLNEKKIKFGLQEVACPLIQCVGMSNEFPNADNGGQELGALFDRFTGRKTVRYVTTTGRKDLLRKAVSGDPCKAVFKHTISPGEIEQAHQEAMLLPWTNDAKQALWAILEELNVQGIFPGDRRIYKSVGAARASAYLNGGTEVFPEHLEVLSHVLWDDPTEQPSKCEKVVARIANPLNVEVMNLNDQADGAVDEAEKQLKGSSALQDREGVCRGVIAKLDEIKRSLSILRQDVKRNKVLDKVEDMKKTWQYKLIGANKE